MGDFNEIKSNDEKQGGPARPERSFVDFRRMIAIGLGISDIGSVRFGYFGFWIVRIAARGSI